MLLLNQLSLIFIRLYAIFKLCTDVEAPGTLAIGSTTTSMGIQLKKDKFEYIDGGLVYYF